MRQKIQTIAALFMILPFAANADVITFDEFAADNENGPLPANRYAHLGITFVATDDGTTYDGLSAGDPKNWGIEGTNGPTFSGFNGTSYGLTMQWDNALDGFSLDASRSNGSSAGNSLQVQGFLGGILVDSIQLVFGAINDWTTFSLTGTLDEVVLLGMADGGFHPYGIDNVVWNSLRVPEPGTFALLSLGVLGMAAARKKKV